VSGIGLAPEVAAGGRLSRRRRDAHRPEEARSIEPRLIVEKARTPSGRVRAFTFVGQ